MVMEYLARKWRRWRWRMEFYATPLELRYSIRVLSQFCQHPFLTLLGLFLRIPRYFPCYLPPAPRYVMAYAPETYVDEKHPHIFQLRLLPVWRWRDSMQRSFYRLYEAFCAYDEVHIGYETEYFWKRQPGWNPELLRDPREDGCTDPEQLAVFASLAEALIWSFNWRLSLGLRRDGRHVEGNTEYPTLSVPTWTNEGPVLDKRLILHKYNDPNDTSSDPDFDKRHIQASSAALRTV
ncbi:hypothetical protein J3458_020787 [Metarhizium acridum]|uniref:uncharacterized protein n=1 Tax=Metarhizium acridum TaxID=92637 RepID=UPI001C6B9406|nr:hypothetical protein J3458_020787 [Metarhizium acridum]